jgi:hypothetical protein
MRLSVSPKCFLHIPKSAGGSIHLALEEALSPGSLAPQRFDSSLFCDFDDFDSLRPEARSQVVTNSRELQSLGRYRAVSGHFSLTALLQIADASSISTVLREPRTRLLSLYMYWRTPNIGDFWTPYRVTEYAQRPFSAFLSESRVAQTVDNQVCRMLLHPDSRLPESGFAAQSDIESIAADAIERLDALGFVGVLELGDSVWQGLARLFDVKLKPAKLNVTEELGDPTATGLGEQLLTVETLDLIEQRNAADLLVYDHALAHAGLDVRERRQLSDGAYAHELVKLGDLVGHSATRVAEQAAAVEVLRSQVLERDRSHVAELEESRGRLLAHERTIQGLRDEVHRRDGELDRLRRWLNAVHASGSWRLTAPLRAAKHGIQRLQPTRRGSVIPARDQSLLTGWSVSQVWWFALVLSLLIAGTDVVLSHVVLIALLAVAPICGLLTGRWARTAAVGIWAVGLGVVLGFPDEIWDTGTQFVDLGVVSAVALLSTFAATLIERRRYHQIR